MNTPNDTGPEPKGIEAPKDAILSEEQKRMFDATFGLLNETAAPADSRMLSTTIPIQVELLVPESSTVLSVPLEDMEFAYVNVRPDGTVTEHPPREPALRPQSRPVRKQMITVLRAANICLLVASDKDGIGKVIEALSGLCDDDLTHAKVWLAGTEPIAASISMDNIEKLLALIDSIERVRPKMVAAVNAAKAMKALTGIASKTLKQITDVMKLKAQTEN